MRELQIKIEVTGNDFNEMERAIEEALAGLALLRDLGMGDSKLCERLASGASSGTAHASARMWVGEEEGE